jgi:LDH2 family malate/lactate/ureidoglycolate dehydrogenase
MSAAPISVLQQFAVEALAVCGLSPADATQVARLILEADLTGVDTHGVIRLPQYIGYLTGGTINPRPQLQVIERGPATALIDGDNGMGHLVMAFAAKTAIELARNSGIGWVGVRRSNHAGAGGIYAAMPIEHGMVGIYAAVSSANHMAIWGGAEPLLGTNPIAIGIPAGDEPAVLIDTATSVSSFGQIRKHMLDGSPIPEGWVVGRSDGKPLTDPKRASEGLLLPIGGHKGSALALAIGLLAGPLNGAAFGRDVRDFGTGATAESNTGQMIIALDVSRFMPLAAFAAEIDRHVRDFQSSARLPGVDEIRIPGAQREKRRQQKLQSGLTLKPALVKQLDDVAAQLGLKALSTRL